MLFSTVSLPVFARLIARLTIFALQTKTPGANSIDYTSKLGTRGASNVLNEYPLKYISKYSQVCFSAAASELNNSTIFRVTAAGFRRTGLSLQLCDLTVTHHGIGADDPRGQSVADTAQLAHGESLGRPFRCEWIANEECRNARVPPVGLIFVGVDTSSPIPRGKNVNTHIRG